MSAYGETDNPAAPRPESSALPESERATLVEVLARFPAVELAYLFGSRGRGGARERSDYDAGPARDHPGGRWT